ncbi:MAG: c-type cytochrome [Haemophilus pittmaniae]|uniref:cytochrome-c peroxidase n=1 Tax=Haemophilus pittmaniae TaxID=249188 RepID=UPI0023F46CF4|nr:cytochrome c peroxidase [Haemophilus pittmaniae]MBS6026031.1 c-type cytochrome [Haemophilus pittmaniae]
MQRKCFALLLAIPCALAQGEEQKSFDYKALGEVLFFDKALSFNQTQSCSTCHHPSTAFVDKRENSAKQMVSQGDNPQLHGNRNANTPLYAMFSPHFHFDEKIQDYVGGQFWDGRAKDLAEQAGGPPLNPLEMGMPDKQTIVARLKANPAYYQAITAAFGEKIWADQNAIYAIMEKALGEFEKETLFAPFSSKYDRALKGEVELTPLEAEGKSLFFDKSKTNCSNCHQSAAPNSPQETFTNYRYYNIGVPSNPELIAHNKLSADFVDNGLLDNPMVNGDEKQKGKFKVPTLRNIAVTAPYMHNGVFRELKTLLEFKDSVNNPQRKLNPQTGQPWPQPEYAATVDPQQLKAPPLSDHQIQALEAFLKTLTDEPYEEE